MEELKFVFGPVPSRRLGISLGISPIPKKTCNYSCIYCQLGRTDRMTNARQMFFAVEEIIDEFAKALKSGLNFDVVTIVGEGEPTLYSGLGELIAEIKKRTNKPVAVITNGALLYDLDLRRELALPDIVLPTMDAYDEVTLKAINRPYGFLDFDKVNAGLETFSKEYQGQLWLELMLIEGINDDGESLRKYSELLKKIRYDRLYINTPVRPPAEDYVKAVGHEKMNQAANLLGGVSIDLLVSKGFQSGIADHYDAVMSIIKRHPMNQFEIESLLTARNCGNIAEILCKIKNDDRVEVVDYKGYSTYRLK